MENIDALKPICYNTNNSDLKDELNKLKINCNTLSVFDVLNNCKNIFQKVILRSVDFRNQKELEITNLNNKIVNFLREIKIYKNYFNSKKGNNKWDEENRSLNNELLISKEGEIIRLNKEIDSLLKTIEKLKQNNKNEYNKEDYSSITNDNTNIHNINIDENTTDEELNNMEKKLLDNILNINKELKQIED